MLTIDIDEFMFELKEGTVKHIGLSNKAATIKFYDVEELGVREFGDERIKVVCEDDGDNELELALAPQQARKLAREVERLEEESGIFE